MDRTTDRDSPWLAGIRSRKHLALLIAIIVLQTIHPLFVHIGVHTRILADIAFIALCISVFLVVFERPWERWLALVFAIPGLVGNVVIYFLPERMQTIAEAFYHGSVLVFLGFAVVVILRDVFGRRIVRVDGFVGSACGYLLAAIAWGSVYVLMNMLMPESFRVAPEISWQLDDWHTRNALFNYFSIVSLTGLGYGDITPINPLLYALVSLEAVFGLFYLAVVVSQLVGLWLISRGVEGQFP